METAQGIRRPSAGLGLVGELIEPNQVALDVKVRLLGLRNEERGAAQINIRVGPLDRGSKCPEALVQGLNTPARGEPRRF